MACILLVVTAAWAEDEPSDRYFEVESLHPVLQAERSARLETPQGCIETFVLSGREGQWRDAAAALDYRIVGLLDQDAAATLAQRFFYVLNQELWIDWNALPDRPDGLSPGSSMSQGDPMAGKVRRSIRMGTISVAGRGIPIHVHRVKPANGDPVWLISAHTVAHIEELWDAHGPSWLARQMPDWATTRVAWRIAVWQWIGLALTLLLAPVSGFWFGRWTCALLGRRLPDTLGALAKELEWPAGGIAAALVVWAMLRWVLGLPSAVATFFEPLSLIVLVAMVVWAVMRALAFVIDHVVKDAIRHNEEGSAEQRRMLTKVAVTRHVLLLAVVLIGIAIVLLHFRSLRTLGVTMLTSAGAMAVILGIGGHAVLGNLIAGLQIALVQPFRIGDTVFVENNWGRIEEMTYVNVIVRTWDERRLVFPIGYFVSNWFENWSKTDQYHIQAIYLKVDYRADVGRIREKFVALVEADEDFAEDRDDPEVLVTESGDECMTVRLTCGGEDSGGAWALVCRVREQLLAWLQQEEDGAYLPRRRMHVQGVADAVPEDRQDRDEAPRGDTGGSGEAAGE